MQVTIPLNYVNSDATLSQGFLGMWMRVIACICQWIHKFNFFGSMSLV
jgi:hypothetical protein